MREVSSFSVYGSSLALLTDLYELTMAYGYWKSGYMKKEAAFYLFFRKRPFGGNMAVTAGLETLIEYIRHFHFDDSDLKYLSSLKGADGSLLFDPRFIEYLKTFAFTIDIDAMPEGTPAFPYEPLIRVQGPLIEAQILESALLNIINFQTLIATKASRVCLAAKGDPVVEFGLRRAQGIDGALSAARAAFIGGCESTSDVLAGKLYGIPVKGTHAHSWIMAFDSEIESFEVYAEAMPANCIFLIDTYDTLQGAKNAVAIGKKMREKGKEMLGVRIDSGDLAQLSIAVRKILDEGGFPKAKIMASNELNEEIISDLKHQGARVDLWGVGTHLVTGKDQPALDGVYKLSAVRDPGKEWKYKLKISEQVVKVTNPGLPQVRRFSKNGEYIADMVYDILRSPKDSLQIIDPLDPNKEKKIESTASHEDLLVPILRKGKPVYEFPPLEEIRKTTLQHLERFPMAMRRFLNPQFYFAGIEKELHELKVSLMKELERS
jgi:nicotinate phosphoribosyltransferase